MHLNSYKILFMNTILLIFNTRDTYAYKWRKQHVQHSKPNNIRHSDLSEHAMLNTMQAMSYSTHSSTGCPDGCHCIWKANKKTVECPNLQLTSIPPNIDGDVQVFNLSVNPLVRLKKGVFHASGLMHLQRIYLSRCKLTTIENGAFTSVSNVVELDLSHNEITAIPTMALKDCPIMSKLHLNNNPINKLFNISFVDLSSLRSLDLSNCRIQFIEANSFEGLKSLRHLHLNGNQLRDLSGFVVETLPSLNELNLYGNEWICDCRLRHLKSMMIKQNIPLSTPPTCKLPKRLSGLEWSKLDLNDFACPPFAESEIDTLTVYEGENATIDCKVMSSPISTIEWQWKGRVISNITYMSFGKQMYLIKEVIQRDEKWSTLNIINALGKDNGRYTCVASNRAGNVSVDVILTVSQRKREPVTEYSGEEVAGIILGLMFAFLLVFLAICFIVLRNKESIVTTVLAGSDERQKSRTFSLVNQNNYSSLERKTNEVDTFTSNTNVNKSTNNQSNSSGDLNFSRTAVTANTTVKATESNCKDNQVMSSISNIVTEDSNSVKVTHDDLNRTNIVNVYSNDLCDNIYNGSNSSTNVYQVSGIGNTTTKPLVTAGFADELQEVWKYRRRASLGNNVVNGDTDETEFTAVKSAISNCAVVGNRNGYGNYSNYATLRLPQKSLKGAKYNLRPITGNTVNTGWIRGVGGSIAALALENNFKGSPDEGLGDERDYETDILD